MVQLGSTKVSEIVQHLSMHAPSSAAEDWDPVGLLLGDPSSKTQAVVLSIDLTEEVIESALKNEAGLIITHHPCIFPKTHNVCSPTSYIPSTVHSILEYSS